MAMPSLMRGMANFLNLCKISENGIEIFFLFFLGEESIMSKMSKKE